MKRMMILLVMALVMFTGSAFAATTTLNVTAVVVGTCAFDTAATDLTFPMLDPVLAPAASATGSVDVSCSTGTPYTVTATSGNGGTLNPTVPGSNIPYTFAFTANDTGTGLGAGVSITVGYQADIGAGVYSGFAADSYSDIVTLEILP